VEGRLELLSAERGMEGPLTAKSEAQLIQPHQKVPHLGDGVYSFLGQTAVGGNTLSLYLYPSEASVGNPEVEVGGLQDDATVGLEILQERLRTEAGMLFIDGADEYHVASQW
jgi:hypothetical protein